MKAEIFGIYNGVSESSFTDKSTGNEVKFRTVTLLDVDSPDTLTCGVEKDVDLSGLSRLDSATFICDLVNGRRPKIIGFSFGQNKKEK